MIFANTEFYYTSPDLISDNNIIIADEEAKHLIKVMRHTINDEIYVTNGEGYVYKAIIKKINKNEVLAESIELYSHDNNFNNITFYIPILKISDRFEFALEKCVELGITNFVIFNSEKSYKRGAKLERWNKIALSAMKQSLRSYKPILKLTDKLSIKTDHSNIIFEQLAKVRLKNYLIENLNNDKQKINFIFGPEAGLTEKDKKTFGDYTQISLTNNRLRTETAIVTAASIICT